MRKTLLDGLLREDHVPTTVYQFARIRFSLNGPERSYGVVKTVFKSDGDFYQTVVADCPDPHAADAAMRLLTTRAASEAR